MEENVYATVTAANTAIVKWINGDGPDTDAGFAGLRAVCHPDLSIVHPRGSHQDHGALLSDLRGAHDMNRDFRIATPREHARLLHEDTNTVVAEFIELQAGSKAVGRPRHARRITVICLKDETAPHGLVIWRLHESFVPADEESDFDWSPLEAAT